MIIKYGNHGFTLFHFLPMPYLTAYQVTQVHHGFTLFHFLPMPYLTAYPTKLPKFIPVFSVAQSFVFCVVFCIVFRFTASNDPFSFYSFLQRFFGTIIYFFKFCQFIFFDQTWNGWNQFSLTYFSFFLSLWCLFIELLSLSLLLQEKKRIDALMA